MPKSSLEELRARISAGSYTVDSGRLAGDILSKFALIRRVRREMIGEGNGVPGDARRGRNASDRRRTRRDLPPRQARLRKEPPG
jgi:hypothetical protein